MAYQCKEPCLPPPTDVSQCSVDAQDSCTFPDMAQCIQTCDCPPPQTCSSPDSLSYQAKQPCTAPSFGVMLCPTATFVPCGVPCLSLHTETCAENPSVPCGTTTLQPCCPCPEQPQPCSSGMAEACAPPTPPTCGSSCSDNCSNPQGDGGMSYVFPGSTVCLEPSGSVSVKPGVSSPELECGTLFLASYKPHFM